MTPKTITVELTKEEIETLMVHLPDSFLKEKLEHAIGAFTLRKFTGIFVAQKLSSLDRIHGIADGLDDATRIVEFFPGKKMKALANKLRDALKETDAFREDLLSEFIIDI